MTSIRPFGLLPTLLLYGAFALAFGVATSWVMPLMQSFGMRTDISWFIAGGTIFAAFGFVTVYMLFREGPEVRRNWRERLWLKSMSKEDWKIALIGLGIAVAGSGAVFAFWSALIPGLSPSPHFLDMRPLAADEYWVLIAWIPLFLLNIGGEGIFGRGYLLPRNERALGQYAWIANGSGWLLFHAAFGPVLMTVIAPLIFAVCWAVQSRRNVTVGFFIHGFVNASGFLAISLGLKPV